MKVGEFLKEMIFNSGMSQKEFAQKCDVAIPIINYCIKNKREITTEYALAFERVLGVPAIVWLTWQINDRLKQSSTGYEKKVL